MITGEGLVLRPPVDDDRPRWWETYADPDERRFGVPAGFALPETLADMDAKVAAAAEAWEARRPGSLVVADADHPEVWLGLVAWRHDCPPQFRTADVGYVVHVDARGRGVAGRAVRTLVRWLVEDEDGPRQARVQLEHSVENLPSCRVALAAGLAREGLRRGFLPLRDAEAAGGVRRHDVCQHGLLAEDPRPSGPAGAVHLPDTPPTQPPHRRAGP